MYISTVEENYLKAIYTLSQNKEVVSTIELSRCLNIKMPTVNSMMKRLDSKGLVSHINYKPITLTEKGKKEAVLIIRKHRLIEMFLVDKMGFKWEEVHEIAEQIEHIKSEIFFDKIDKLLNYPKFDPHGSPIPSKTGKINNSNYIRLSDCKKGDIVIVKHVKNDSKEFLNFLSKKNLKLETELVIEDIEDYDNIFQVRIVGSGNLVSMSDIVTNEIFIQKSNKF